MLKNDTQFKRRNLYRLPSYHLRLLALPNRIRMATQKPTLKYVYRAKQYLSRETVLQARYDIPRASTVAQSLNSICHCARIPNGQESARINAFQNVIPEALLRFSADSPPSSAPDRGF